ncbi:MAG: MgtC/SapB family protein [Turicibacter sp.]|nr:MgtC/SapB family protein [Turicibacter sp.]
MDYQTLIDITLRTLFSMFIGGIIGWERESSHRPAGLRTHMLVAVGACIIMQLGTFNSIYIQTNLTSDPSRLGAQVISGIGFLGAGTIIKEGTSIKGLTTAASLWVVACLGLAIGAGAYTISIIGCLSVILTLTVFEHASSIIPFRKSRRFFIHIHCSRLNEVLQHVNLIGKKYKAAIVQLKLNISDNGFYELSFNFSTKQLYKTLDTTTLFQDFNNNQSIVSVVMTEY